MLKMSELRARVREDVLRHKREASMCGKNARIGLKELSKLLPAIKRAKLYPSIFAGVSGRVYVSVSYPVKSFKDPGLVRLLESAINVLGESGIASQDYADMGLREYKINGAQCRLEVNARLDGEGTPLCRRIKVGEERVVVEKYEFRCD